MWPVVAGIALGISAIAQVTNTILQAKENEYRHEIQRESFRREDNAVSRRVRDMQNAGLSPVLAAGSAADVGPVVATQAPQITDIGGQMAKAATIAQTGANIDNQIANTRLTKKSIDTQTEMTKKLRMEQALLVSKTRHEDAKAYEQKALNNMISQTGYNPKYASQLGKMTQDVKGAFDKIGVYKKGDWRNYLQFFVPKFPNIKK